MRKRLPQSRSKRVYQKDKSHLEAKLNRADKHPKEVNLDKNPREAKHLRELQTNPKETPVYKKGNSRRVDKRVAVNLNNRVVTSAKDKH